MKYQVCSTNTLKRKFNDSDKTCIFCGKKIIKYSQLGYSRLRDGRRIIYRFFHYDCLSRVVLNVSKEKLSHEI